MGQFAITRTVMVAAGRFAPGHLGELTQQVPFEMVDAVLAETGTVQRRVRDLPSRVVVYLLLAACLFPEVGYPGVRRKLTAGLYGIPTATPTAGALAQARRGVGMNRRRSTAHRRPGPDRPGLHRRRARHPLVRRHHLRRDRRRLGVHRDRDRPALAQGRGLRRGRPPAHQPGRRGPCRRPRHP